MYYEASHLSSLFVENNITFKRYTFKYLNR